MKCAVDETIAYVKHLAQQLMDCNASGVVLVILMRLRIPTNYDGFEYLKTAILLRYENPMRTMVNDIYPELRKRYGKHITNEQLETAIRSAIIIGWKRAGSSIWKVFFPTILAEEERRRPSNTEFIYELARIVELWCDCAEAYARQRTREEVGYGIK